MWYVPQKRRPLQTSETIGYPNLQKKSFISSFSPFIFEADKIEDVSRYEKNALQFSKLLENEYFTIFEVITITGEKKKLYKKNRLAFKTMFVRKSK